MGKNSIRWPPPPARDAQSARQIGAELAQDGLARSARESHEHGRWSAPASSSLPLAADSKPMLCKFTGCCLPQSVAGLEVVLHLHFQFQ